MEAISAGIVSLSLLELYLRFPLLQKKNFVQKLLPLSGIPLALVFAAILRQEPLLSLALLFVALAGGVDDLVASPEKGFRGHLKALRQGKLTSGFFKAGTIFSFSLLFCSVHAFPFFLVQALALSAWCNFFNLLDTAPGRAGKVFFLLVLPFSPLPLLVSFLPFWVADLRKRTMLGDAGANLLGFVVGVFLAQSFPYFSLLLFPPLLALQLYLEKHSLSSIIAGSPFLLFLDRVLVKK